MQGTTGSAVFEISFLLGRLRGGNSILRSVARTETIGRCRHQNAPDRSHIFRHDKDMYMYMYKDLSDEGLD
jgi:hypothetical protein